MGEGEEGGSECMRGRRGGEIRRGVGGGRGYRVLEFVIGHMRGCGDRACYRRYIDMMC